MEERQVRDPPTDTHASSSAQPAGFRSSVKPFGSATESTFATSNLRRANTVAQGGGNISKNNLESSAVDKEKPAEVSQLRTRDSHELLQKPLSLKRSLTQRGPRDALVNGRGGSHFTVGSVGQNGKIFLRPIRNLSIKEPRAQQQQPLSSSTDPSQSERLHPNTAHSHGQGANDPRWSNSQLSELQPDVTREENVVDDGESVTTESARSEYRQQNRQRPHSFSTISEHQSTSSIRPRGEYQRIVIDRSDDRRRSDIAEEPSAFPTLEVSIPHYRLGIPQFNKTESPALQSSRGSTQGYFRTSPLLGENLNSHPLSNVLSDSVIPERPSFVSSILSDTGVELGPDPTATEVPIFYEMKEPIEPSVFETLVSDMDDESVVRYIPGTKELSAATPARIVAQISSESFMDYELVSDFFLTYRSYLSPSHLLRLLLARLQWAINRWQDDGRIIRIRTFAALRHWILNYFTDDFAEDYELRVYFCDIINLLYNDVKSRENGGTSDLKILIDLKRCWHGKCAMIWDAPELSSAYYHQDSPVVPGGLIETIDGDQGERAQHFVQPGLPLSIGDDSVNVDAGQEPTLAQHYRTHSGATNQSIPVTVQSDDHCLAASCSFPPKSHRRPSNPPPKTAPHPVPLSPAKYAHVPPPPKSSTAASTKRRPFYTHAHKRSGSFSDSVRDDRAPLPLLKLDQWGISSQEILDPASLIRGTLYPPAESYMTMMAPLSPPLPLGSVPGLERQSTADGTSKPTTSGSGVKTIIGSIRRAINGAKHGNQNISRHTRGYSGSPFRGKTSTLPNNVAFGSDYYRDRKTTARSKKPTRIDTLCDEVLRQYRQVIADREETKQDPPQQEASMPRLQVPPSRIGSQVRSQSGLTMGSESIVIVDDTGLDIPMVSGANGEPIVDFERSPGFLNAGNGTATPKTDSLRVPSTRGDDKYSLRIFYDDSAPAGSSHQPSKTFYNNSDSSASRRSISIGHALPFRKRTSPSLRLRKYASFQSIISRRRPATSANGEPVPLVADLNVLQDEPETPTGPILRRRPGGDLRKMQNGKNRLSYLRSRSTISVAESELTASTRDVQSRRQTSLIPPNPRYSLIQTNSSQDVRRSFEAAIAKFAQIPDDDDGGVESTLLKLEGKWDGPETPRADGEGSSSAPHHRNMPVVLRQNCNDDGFQRRPTFLGDPLTYSQVRERMRPVRPYSDSVAESEESFSSIPLLERGLSDESMKKPPALSRVATNPAATPRASRTDTSDWDSSRPSTHVINKTESISRIPRGSTVPVPRPLAPRDRTRLSELSLDVIDRREILDGRPSTDSARLSRSSYRIPPHPLAQPPSPPMTIQNPRSITSCATPLNPVIVQAQPLTPDPSPSRRNAQPDPSRFIDMQQDVLSRSENGQQQPSPVAAPDVDHVPFILACESQLLAQQLTLVEMAALSEIDWRDLVEMRWSSGSPTTLSWVQFLTSEDHRGIDLVVGRFNLMVKWVLSEIVLTQDIHERVQTISKFIHVAVHAKRMCNYATMLQIAIALSSINCARLEKTWSLVSPEDKRLLKDMEALIQPVRNFHDLRVEMETANLQEGCIPFVGLYIHDLNYNSQKPAQVTTQAGEPLINFERHRTTARIVKNLLRLIDASTKYAFEPVQGVIERCLWIASLDEEGIQTRSRDLD
ncbi:mitotic regulator LTE1 [Aspergillus chevalieri]|uniref:Guanine nucleotide exchange factor lte1 n=1 Tax=Aspergillus chevalieri TaxID=182096 RepID=A0A7R7ZL68_ASPCH|nr:guanine nucleotide exchange factor lte1 [Aspergillus chevalieri]BCR84827.1 guanine nucleotide exchange factor lte1 [Aspergillus chevalieri]